MKTCLIIIISGVLTTVLPATVGVQLVREGTVSEGVNRSHGSGLTDVRQE